MSDTNTAIHEAVRKRYGAIAQNVSNESTAKADCCSGPASDADCSCSPTLYSPEMLSGLPVDVTGLSLGCGDPVTIAGLKSGEAVLDLGSGGGIDCFLAMRQVGPTGHVIGVDMTPEMLARANANKAQLKADNVEFRKGQIEALPVDDAAIDVVMSNCVINLAPDKRPVFAEAFRVLKPGGRVSFSDIVTEGDFSDELKSQLEDWSACVTGAIDVAIYVHLLKEVGFEDVQILDKVSAEEIVEQKTGMPRLFSARIVAHKPA